MVFTSDKLKTKTTDLKINNIKTATHDKKWKLKHDSMKFSISARKIQIEKKGTNE